MATFVPKDKEIEESFNKEYRAIRHQDKIDGGDRKAIKKSIQRDVKRVNASKFFTDDKKKEDKQA